MSEMLSSPQVWRFHKGGSEVSPSVKPGKDKYTIYSWVIVPGPPNREQPENSLTPIRLAKGFAEQAPVTLVYIQTPKGNLILSQITDLKPEEVADNLEIGTKVEPVVRVLRSDGSGPIIYGTKFRLPLKPDNPSSK